MGTGPAREAATHAGRQHTRHVAAVRAAARLAKVSGSALAEVDLTLAQYRVLVFLDRGERPASHVATLLDVAPSTVTSVVDGLCARGLVERGEDLRDRRRVVLSLTALGATQLDRGDRVVAERLGRLLQRLSDQDADTVLVGLDHLNTAMEDYLVERFGQPGDGA